VERPPGGEGGATRSNSTAIAPASGRSWNGNTEDAQRSRLDIQVPQIAQAAASLPDCIIDGEVCAVNERGVPDLQPCKRPSLRATRRISSSLRSICVHASRGLARTAAGCPQIETQRAPRVAADKLSDRIRYLDHFVTAGDAVLRSACRIEMEGSSPSAWMRLTLPTAAVVGSSPNAAPATKSSSAAGPRSRHAAVAHRGGVSREGFRTRGPGGDRVRPRQSRPLMKRLKPLERKPARSRERSRCPAGATSTGSSPSWLLKSSLPDGRKGQRAPSCVQGPEG